MDAELVTPLLKGCITGQLHGLFAYICHSFFIDMKNINNIINNNKLPPHLLKQPLKKYLLLPSISATASLGTFEILTQKLKNGNGGQPLTLYQEACCGFISGSTAMLLRTPFEVASKRIPIHTFTYTNCFTTLHQMLLKEGASSLWRGYGLYMSSGTASYAGMLVSYDRSLNYLVQTQGLPIEGAHICSSIVSGFFAAACGHPVHYAGGIVEAALKRKLDYARVLPSIRKLLTPYSGCNFYTHFLFRFRHATSFCMAQYAILEQVRKMEWTKKQE